MKVKKQRGYSIIEPPIYDELNWNMELITSCLEFIRTKLPELFSEFPKGVKYELIPLENPFVEAQPVIGLYSNNKKDLEKIPEFLDLDEPVEIWIDGIGIESIKKASKKMMDKITEQKRQSTKRTEPL